MPDGPDPRSDRALLAAHAAGEPHAFEEIVRRHVDRLWVFALRILDHREDASDAVQDALIAAFRSAPGYRGDSEVSTWLHRIVLNTCRDRLRRRRARSAESIVDHDVPGPRDPVDEHLTRMTVAAALTVLPTEQRLAIILVDVQGFSVAETAEILEVAEGTIKSRCARGRSRLARALGHLRPRETATPRHGPREDRGHGTGRAPVEPGERPVEHTERGGRR